MFGVSMSPLATTIALAIVTTAMLAVTVVPACWWLASRRSPGMRWVETVWMLPLVLPPTVLGFYFLMLWSPTHWAGRWWAIAFGGTPLFTFAGIVMVSFVANWPLAAMPILSGFRSIDAEMIEAMYCMGNNRRQTFWKLALPSSADAIIAGLSLAFAHACGQFGAILMVGGNIAGRTRTLSIEVYDRAQSLDMAAAHRSAICLILFAGLSLLISTRFRSMGGRSV